jgi:hypothetical protein
VQVALPRVNDVGRTLSDILDPNRMFEARWSAYTIETNDGRTLAGLIQSETTDAIVLAMPGGATGGPNGFAPCGRPTGGPTGAPTGAGRTGSTRGGTNGGGSTGGGSTGWTAGSARKSAAIGGGISGLD